MLICGAGSIGIYLGVKLHEKGHDVKLFGRKKLGSTKESIIIDNKKFEIPKKLFKIPKNEKFDFVFLTTKLYDLEKMIKSIKNSGMKYSVIAEIQNGLVDTSKYKKMLNKNLIPVCVFSGFNLSGNKIIVKATPVGWKTENSATGKKIIRVISNAGIKCTTAKNLDSMRAEKTIINCCLNGLSAIEKKSFNLLFRNKKTRERIEKLFYECHNILKQEYNLDSAEKIKKRMYKNWSKLNHYSSTYQDLVSGRKSEIGFFNGYIVELGKKYNLPTENNEEILEDFKRLKR